jgi:hypothetical protein
MPTSSPSFLSFIRGAGVTGYLENIRRRLKRLGRLRRKNLSHHGAKRHSGRQLMLAKLRRFQWEIRFAEASCLTRSCYFIIAYK